jgi:hypothetical protein
MYTPCNTWSCVRQARLRRRLARDRRGILILVVLTLLTLFVMISVTFVLIANRHRNVSKKASQAELVGDNPRIEVDNALNVLIRGDNNPLSPFWNTSLLPDIYGDKGKQVEGRYSVDNNTGICKVTITKGNLLANNEHATHYDGRVITFLRANNNLNAKEMSSRIYGSDESGNNIELYVFPFRDPQGIANINNQTATFLINGREFSGTGKLALTTNSPVNPVPRLIANADPTTATGENESYDAPDFNNPFMAYIDRSVNPPKIKPSFHDSALIAKMGMSGGGQEFRFRPLPNNFNSANSGFTDANGPWDVDNDGDGFPDSIWIDPGMPVMVTRDGRLYKRLIAPLILPLDDRININTAGTDKEKNAVPPAPMGIPYATTGAITLPRGNGFGPAEINPALTSLGYSQFGTLLNGSGGRYGNDNHAGPDTNSNMSRKLTNVPDDYAVSGQSVAMMRSFGGGPPDIWGRFLTGVDWTGNLLYANYWGGTANTETQNVPYTIDLRRDAPRGRDVGGTNLNNIYSAAELEALLRIGDADAANLPQRLVNNIGTANKGLGFASFTTDSWDLPVLGTLPKLTNTPNVQPTHITEIIPNAWKNSAAEVRRFVPPDMLAGLKFNLNWQFGDGKDGNNNWVVDEPAELDTAPNPLPNYSQGVDNNSDSQINNDDNKLARQQVARYLYCLMYLLNSQNQQPLPEATAYRLAQWSINVVDFMDADNIMTPFEYDKNPLDGWETAADGTINQNDLQSYTQQSSNVRLAWGCEQPVLLMTESLAWHDRRVRDSKHDDKNKKKRDENDKDDPDKDGKKDKKRDDDLDLDQALIPRGPGFVELLHTRSPIMPVGSGDLYEYDTNRRVWRLKLDKRTPDGVPVWRIAVTNHQSSATFFQNTGNIIFTGQTDQSNATAGYNITTLYPAANNPPARPDIERIIVFCKPGQIGANTPDRNRTYCYSDTNASNGAGVQSPDNLLLFGGQYALLFPHTPENANRSMGYTNNGFLNYPLGNIVDGNVKGKPSKQGIRINYSTNSAPFYAGTSGKTIVNAHDSNGTNHVIYNNVDFNTPALIPIASADNAQNWGSSVGLSFTEPVFSGVSGNYYPQPTVNNPATSLLEAYGDPTDEGQNGNARDKPLDTNNSALPSLTAGTTENAKVLILQRIADPTTDYNAISNPYLTVDWLPIDITIFNGDDRPPGNNPEFDENVESWDRDDPNANKGNTPNPILGSRQRGQLTQYQTGQNATTAPNQNSNYDIWKPTATKLTSNNPTAKDTNAIFAFEMDRGQANQAGSQTLGFLNSSYGDPKAVASLAGSPMYAGAPQRPFPGLNWNNRPFHNPYEVMNVPASAISRLGTELGVAYQTQEDYASQPNGNGAPFGNMLNFFAASPAQNGSLPIDSSIGNFHRLLDFLTTGPRFVGSETWLDNTKAQNIGSATLPGLARFRTPFNAINNYREPGKINLNGLSSQPVMDALMNEWTTKGNYGGTLTDLVSSRRLTNGGNQLDANTNYPTYFANPFRNAASAPFVPSGHNLDQTTVNVGLLRQKQGGTNTALFGPNTYDPGTASDYKNASRQRPFALSNIERLSNLTTTRSNVYAIWVTVGYFEVFPDTSNTQYQVQGGYRMGNEIGSDTGEISRHRGFAIIDRTIPVGYERGVNHNVDKVFLIKKILE